jgi:hypothetical protein
VRVTGHTQDRGGAQGREKFEKRVPPRGDGVSFCHTRRRAGLGEGAQEEAMVLSV